MSAPNVSRITSEDILNFDNMGIDDEVSDIQPDELRNDYNEGAAKLDEIPDSQEVIDCDDDDEPEADKFGYHRKSYDQLRAERVQVKHQIAMREYHIQKNDPKKLLRKLRQIACIQTVTVNEEMPKVVQDFNFLMSIYRKAKDDARFCEQAMKILHGCQEAYHSASNELSEVYDRLAVIDALLPIAEKKAILEDEKKVKKRIIAKQAPIEDDKCYRSKGCTKPAKHVGACRKLRVKPY